MKATYRNVITGSKIKNKNNMGEITISAFGYVLVNWDKLNPKPLPPIPYTAEIWDYLFWDYEIVD